MPFGPISLATRARRSISSATRALSSKTGAGGVTRMAGAGTDDDSLFASVADETAPADEEKKMVAASVSADSDGRSL